MRSYCIRRSIGTRGHYNEGEIARSIRSALLYFCVLLYRLSLIYSMYRLCSMWTAVVAFPFEGQERVLTLPSSLQHDDYAGMRDLEDTLYKKQDQ